MKISLITVCYNSSTTILDNIISVSDQTYSKIEHVFIDGKSSDDTVRIIKNNSSVEFKLISEDDDGIYHAMNKGIKLASGDIIGILNSDDAFSSNYIISKVINKFQETNCDILYGNINYKNKTGETVRIWDSSLYSKGSFVKGWHPPHPSLFVKKSVYDSCGLFDTDFKIAADFEFMLRVFEKNDFKISYLNETLVSMLVGGKSNTLRGIISGQKEIKMAFKKNNIYLPKFYFVRRYLKKLKEYLKWFQ